MRVSLLAPVPTCRRRTPTVVAKVPLRLERGPEGAFVALDVRTRQIARARRQLRGADGRARSRDAGAAAAGLDVQADRLLVRAPRAPLHAGDARRREARGLRRRLQARATTKAGPGHRSAAPARGARELRQRRRGARARGRRARERRAVGAGARHRVDDEAGSFARARQLRGRARSSSSARTRRSRRAASTKSRASSRASSGPTARTSS